ncbi:hypothetical protein GCM10008904_00180 [Paraclostridium ghonii]|uniref:ABC-2 type transport system permease protein n=1 Tax=Paraclostridium ghonii TaxID=29358 RepID=A0ABU0MYA1_9FIRM|nr:ABC transporter permease [Paeniclostridium ghonii]MDQ0555877.1 ABC-2 type transport system permease protein [Paeniclostridium ghonii]
MILTQIKYDLKMFTRELFYLAFTVILPPVSYIIMGQMFGGNTYNGGMSYAQIYTPSFIILISFSVIFFAFGFDQVMNRSFGIERRLLITPITDKVLLISAIVKTIIITSMGFFLISLIGIFVYDLKLTVPHYLISYVSLMGLNALLLVFSHALYKNFNDMKSALVTSIVLFQVVMFTGGFSIPVEQLPKFMKVIANINPVYHISQIYMKIWNESFEINKDTINSLLFLAAVLVISLLVIKFSKKKG